MTKIEKNILPGEVALDTIRNFCSLDQNKANLKAFNKRRRAKAITQSMAAKLGAIGSPLQSGYKRAYHCANYLLQDGTKVTSNYCKHRCCNVCNRIKSAKMLQGYAKPLLEIKDIHFLTLTAPNVSGDDLRGEIDRMLSKWRSIYNSIKKYRKDLPLKGMYKLECTYNYRSKNYNPHLHFIISTEKTGNEIIKKWLEHFPKAKRAAQDIRKANEKSLYELFKYVTKSVVSKNYSAVAMDIIYQALHNRNTYYRIGIKKTVTEEIDDLQSQIISFKSERVDVWKWCYDKKDWYTSDGEPFIGIDLSDKSMKIIEVIDSSEIPDNRIITEEEVFNKLRKEKLEPIF